MTKWMWIWNWNLFWEGWKTLWEKEKMLGTSISPFATMFSNTFLFRVFVTQLVPWKTWEQEVVGSNLWLIPYYFRGFMIVIATGFIPFPSLFNDGYVDKQPVAWNKFHSKTENISLRSDCTYYNLILDVKYALMLVHFVKKNKTWLMAFSKSFLFLQNWPV